MFHKEFKTLVADMEEAAEKNAEANEELNIKINEIQKTLDDAEKRLNL